jgi:hypothetical protein
MKPSNSSSSEVVSTAIQLSITFKSQDSGVCILTRTSSHTKSQSVSSSPKSRELKQRQTTQTVTKTSVRTLQSLALLHQLIGQTLTVTKAKPGQWCDYCKMRWGQDHPNGKGKTFAVWTVVSQHAKSKGINRHYCQPCAVWVSIWPDGSHWPLTEQAEFLVKQEEIDHGV